MQNHANVAVNATDYLKQNNSIPLIPEMEYEEKRENVNVNVNVAETDEKAENNVENDNTKSQIIRITPVMWVVMGYMNDCWHSYFKKDGDIWCIEDCARYKMCIFSNLEII